MNRKNVLPVPAPEQLTLTFEPGLVERYPTALDVVRRVAYGHRNKLQVIAAEMDLSQSSLTRKLAQHPDDPRRFSLDDLERFIVATGDVTVVEYLAAKYLQSDDQRRASAISATEGLLRELSALLPALRSVA